MAKTESYEIGTLLETRVGYGTQIVLVLKVEPSKFDRVRWEYTVRRWNAGKGEFKANTSRIPHTEINGLAADSDPRVIAARKAISA